MYTHGTIRVQHFLVLNMCAYVPRAEIFYFTLWFKINLFLFILLYYFYRSIFIDYFIRHMLLLPLVTTLLPLCKLDLLGINFMVSFFDVRFNYWWSCLPLRNSPVLAIQLMLFIFWNFIHSFVSAAHFGSVVYGWPGLIDVYPLNSLYSPADRVTTVKTWKYK